MALKVYRLIFIIITVVILIEVLLEVRAQSRGWSTLLSGLLVSCHTGHSVNSENELIWGPTDKFPFRSRIIPNTDSSDVIRIWIASSSYAQDIYLKPNLIFPNIIEQILNNSSLNVQILNAAQEGQTIEGNVKTIQEIGAFWKPNYVILYQMNLDINQLSNPNYKEKNDSTPIIKPQTSWGAKIFEHTTLYQIIKENITARISQQRILLSEIGSNAREKFRTRVIDLINASRSIGATPILCTFAASYDTSNQFNVPTSVKNFLLRYNIYLSLEGWFKAIDAFNEEIRQIGQKENLLVIDINRILSGKKEYFRDFVHFNPAGHEMIASIIAQMLKDKVLQQ